MLIINFSDRSKEEVMSQVPEIVWSFKDITFHLKKDVSIL